MRQTGQHASTRFAALCVRASLSVAVIALGGCTALMPRDVRQMVQAQQSDGNHAARMAEFYDGLPAWPGDPAIDQEIEAAIARDAAKFPPPFTADQGRSMAIYGLHRQLLLKLQSAGDDERAGAFARCHCLVDRLLTMGRATRTLSDDQASFAIAAQLFQTVGRHHDADRFRDADLRVMTAFGLRLAMLRSTAMRGIMAVSQGDDDTGRLFLARCMPQIDLLGDADAGTIEMQQIMSAIGETEAREVVLRQRQQTAKLNLPNFDMGDNFTSLHVMMLATLIDDREAISAIGARLMARGRGDLTTLGIANNLLQTDPEAARRLLVLGLAIQERTVVTNREGRKKISALLKPGDADPSQRSLRQSLLTTLVLENTMLVRNQYTDAVHRGFAALQDGTATASCWRVLAEGDSATNQAYQLQMTSMAPADSPNPAASGMMQSALVQLASENGQRRAAIAQALTFAARYVTSIDALRAKPWLLSPFAPGPNLGFQAVPMLNACADHEDPDLTIACYVAAILSIENIWNRAKDSAEELDTFANGPEARTVYPGLIRSLLRRNGDGDGDRALTVASVFQARQLKTLRDGADIGAPLADPLAYAAAIRATLHADEGLLVAIPGPKSLSLIVATRDACRGASIDLPQVEQERLIAQVRLALGGNAGDAGLGFDEAYGRLSQLLIDPVRDLLASHPRWWVVAGGALATIPWEVLRVDAQRDFGSAVELGYLPSPDWFLGEAKGAVPARRVLAVGDPAFVAAPITAPGAPDLRAATFTPLPETRSEIDAVAQGFPADGRVVLLGSDATRERVLASGLSAFSHIHLATHGILAGEVASLREPALVLTGDGDEDGFLTMSDVSGMDLAAELCVLSACNTGSGKVVGGEGVMGLSRAFLRAGSRHVLVSLWPVDSAATEQLMVVFYRELAAGAPAALALRSAKDAVAGQELALASHSRGFKKIESPLLPTQGRLRSAYFWAPFILIGDAPRAPAPILSAPTPIAYVLPGEEPGGWTYAAIIAAESEAIRTGGTSLIAAAVDRNAAFIPEAWTTSAKP